jgi:hypothetical protein
LYEEAIDVFLAEHHVGVRVYPKPGGEPALPAEWVRGNDPFPGALYMTRDSKWLMAGGRLIDADTGGARLIEAALPLRTSIDPMGKLIGRRVGTWAVELIERATGQRVMLLDPKPLRIWTYRYSPDGRALALITTAPLGGDQWKLHALEVWDVGADRARWSVTLPAELVAAPEFSDDGQFLAWPMRDAIRIYASSDGRLAATVPAPGFSGLMGALAISPDGSQVAWSGGVSAVKGNAVLHVTRVTDGQPVRDLETTGPIAVVQAVFTPDGRFVVGRTGIGEHDYIARTIVRLDANQGPIFQSHANRVCVWDAADGRLAAWVRGRALAAGIGPAGEFVTLRARGTGEDADPELDLWRPAELAREVARTGLADWTEVQGSSGTADWVFGIVSVLSMLFAIGWMTKTIQRIQAKRLVSASTAYSGAAVTLLLTGWGVVCLITLVAGLYGDAEKPWGIDLHRIYLTVCGLLALLMFMLAILTGGLTIKCYAFTIHGESVRFFEVLQSVPESDRKGDEEKARRLGRRMTGWILGTVACQAAVLYLDDSFLIRLARDQWNTGFLPGLMAFMTVFGFGVSGLVMSLFPLALVALPVAVGDAVWGPTKEPWFKLRLPPGVEPTGGSRFIVRVFNLFPLSRGASTVFWLMILVASLAVGSDALRDRLATGDWPRGPQAGVLPANRPPLPDPMYLSIAAFYTVVSAAHLLRRLRGKA